MKLKLLKIDGVFIGADPESAAIIAEFGNNVVYEAEIRDIKTRTPKQHSSLFLYCTFVAEALNDSGQYMNVYFDPEVWVGMDILWTKDLVKRYIWNEIQLAISGKESSTRLKTTEVQEIYLNISQDLSLNRGVNVPWPNRRSN
jgi:hypothetical protein